MNDPKSRLRIAWQWIAALVPFAAGCAGPGPLLFPIGPMRVERLADGRSEQWYDVDGDGRAEYAECVSADGLIDALRYRAAARAEPGAERSAESGARQSAESGARRSTESGARRSAEPGAEQSAESGVQQPASPHSALPDATRGASSGDELVRLAAVPAAERRDLVLILDSVPFDMVRDLRDHGRFQFFPRPTRIIAPFPVMTDLSLAEFFGASPCPGVEASYYEGHELTSGYEKYAGEGNTPWVPFTQYRMDPRKHFDTYLDPPPWFDHELREIQQLFMQGGRPVTVAYCVGTSAIGAKIGRDGHQAALVRVDRLCRRIMHDTRGRARISMFSDHGHDFTPSRRIRFATRMKALGYHDGPRLTQPYDVIAVEFGLVTCASIYTDHPAWTAADAVGLDGVELVAYDSRGELGGELSEADAGLPPAPSPLRGESRGLIAPSPLKGEDRGLIAPSPLKGEGWGEGDSSPTASGQSAAENTAADHLIVLSRDGRAAIERRGDRYRYTCMLGDPLQLRPVLAALAARGAVDADGFADDRALFEATQLHAYPDVVHRLWRSFHGLVDHPPQVLLSAEIGHHFGAMLMQELVNVIGLHGSLRLVSSSGFAMSMGGLLPGVVRMEDLRGDFGAVGVAIPGREAAAGRASAAGRDATTGQSVRGGDLQLPAESGHSSK